MVGLVYQFCLVYYLFKLEKILSDKNKYDVNFSWQIRPWIAGC